jgi:AbiV family abortive infection protein
VDLGAVKTAATPDLVRCAAGAAANAQGLLDDAELLAAAGRHARAYTLAALAVEEAGKAVSLGHLAMLPVSLRAQAPVGRMVAWHQLKLVSGMVIAAVPLGLAGVPFGGRCLAVQLAAMPPSQAAGILDAAQALAEDQDRLKQRGLYADFDRGGLVRLPSEVSETDVAAQLACARQAASSASVLLHPRMPALLANPPTESIELGRALVRAFAEAGCRRTPQAAAGVMLAALRRVQEPAAASEARAPCDHGRRQRGTDLM